MSKIDEKVHVKTLGLMSEIDRVLSENVLDDNSIPARVERLLRSASPNKKNVWFSRDRSDEEFELFLDAYTNHRDIDESRMMDDDLLLAISEVWEDENPWNFLSLDYCAHPCPGCSSNLLETISPIEFDNPPFCDDYEPVDESCGAEGCGCEGLFDTCSPITHDDPFLFEQRVYDGLSFYPVVGVWPKDDFMILEDA